jgi:hypothetical protein
MYFGKTFPEATHHVSDMITGKHYDKYLLCFYQENM